MDAPPVRWAVRGLVSAYLLLFVIASNAPDTPGPPKTGSQEVLSYVFVAIYCSVMALLLFYTFVDDRQKWNQTPTGTVMGWLSRLVALAYLTPLAFALVDSNWRRIEPALIALFLVLAAPSIALLLYPRST